MMHPQPGDLVLPARPMSTRRPYRIWAFLTLLCAAVAPPAWAAGTMPAFYTELVCLIIVCALMGYLCFRIGLVPILGFLMTGVVLNALGLVQSPALVEAMAEVGVILLLFTIGIEFSIESLMRIRRLIFVGGGVQVGLTTGLVTGILVLLGVEWRASLFTGMLVALSSTAIVLKLLENRGETRSDAGNLAVGMLIFQDLAVVGMVIAIPLLGNGGDGAEGHADGQGGGMDQLLSLAGAVALVVVVLLIARKLVPKVLELLARACSPEVFLLGVIAICLGTAWVTGFAGVSVSLGAFLAGLLVSESRFGSQALGEILPLQILFSATFFVSVGLLLDVGFLMRHLPLVLLVVAGVLVLKATITIVSAKVLGYAAGPAVASGLLLAQVGEFSFVLERAGREAGLSPAGIDGAGGQTFIAASVVLMGLTPFLAQAGAALDQRLRAHAASRRPKNRDDSSPRTGSPRAVAAAGDTAMHGLADHVLILGYGRSGKWLSRQLHQADLPCLVITLSPIGAAEAEAMGVPVLRGDYTKMSLLREGGLRQARLVVIADDTLEVAERAVAIIHANLPEMVVLAKMALEGDAQAMRGHGAQFAISDEAPSHRALLAEVFSRCDRAPELAAQSALSGGMDSADGALVLTMAQRASPHCSHTDQARPVVPEAHDICPECVLSGDRWVHLRVCMTCGHVGCCDSSKNRHASRHADSAGHLLARSLEAGEDWVWCFSDETLL